MTESQLSFQENLLAVERLVRVEVQLDNLQKQQERNALDHKADLLLLRSEIGKFIDETKKDNREFSAILNKGRGAYAVSMIIAVSIGSVITILAPWLLGRFFGGGNGH